MSKMSGCSVGIATWSSRGFGQKACLIMRHGNSRLVSKPVLLPDQRFYDVCAGRAETPCEDAVFGRIHGEGEGWAGMGLIREKEKDVKYSICNFCYEKREIINYCGFTLLIMKPQ